MGDFKEWLSDNLRYFLVGVVVILIIGGSILGLKIYSSAVNGKDEKTDGENDRKGCGKDNGKSGSFFRPDSGRKCFR